jgi:hypothetical protein
MKTLTATIVRPGQFSPEAMDQMAQDLRTKGTCLNPLNGRTCRVLEVHNDGRGLTVTMEVDPVTHSRIANPPPGPMSMGCKVR